ncbi:MAG: site-specific DNA-methyltransferase [Candidatus Limnocylindrales bacterium]
MPELAWDGKRDRDGKRVAPLKVALPFQTIETVNESAQERQRSLDLFSAGQIADWRNRLIWGDKKYVLPALLAEFAGKVDLIYIDPPFATGQDFSFEVEIGGHELFKPPSMIEVKAYRDTWGVSRDEAARGVLPLDRYLGWFYETLVLLHELLASTGSLWVHLDYRVAFYVKCVIDEVFGSENFRNDVIWSYGGSGRGAKAVAGQFPRNHDILLWYGKTATTTYQPQYAAKRTPIAAATKAGYRQDPDGRWFKTAPRGDYTDESIAALDAEGRIHRTTTGSIRIKYFLRQEGDSVVEDVLLGDTWTDIPDAMHLADAEKTGYATQKPPALLKRIIASSSRPNDLVLDCFVGGGTTAVAADQLGRRWIACDLSRFAIHVTRKQLLSIPDVRPFVVQNLGKYERQVWQAAQFGSDAEGRVRAYRQFILDLYRAKPIDGYIWLHGVKTGRMVYVGTVDSPVTVGDVRQIAAEFRRATGSGPSAPTKNGVDVLGWDFAFELNEVAKQEAARAKIDVRFFRIPREVLDSRAVEQGDVQFFELAALSVDVSRAARRVGVELTEFVIPVDKVPDDIQRAVTHWSQWIDYWAVDWDNHGDTFHNEWQTYRSRTDPELKRKATRAYESPGIYQIVVKVIDILGNDTTKTIEVQVP